ncbi:MAG TPA: DNA polymerase III subunit delta [Microscillaceae bacterium]|nr:DNA polymerase III subunit delta [Microscillaceae bacterium]
MVFEEIYGLSNLKQQLIHSVQNGRVSHAQLFWGKPGSATLPMAMAYAQYILCEAPTPEDACGQCKACQNNQKFIHPDLNFVFPVATNEKVPKLPKSNDFLPEWRNFLAQQPYGSLSQWLQTASIEQKQALIGVEESRQVIRTLSLKPVESIYKILLLWLPEYLNTNAANALLKILEEPAPNTVFLLVSESPQQVLPTIQSRVQMVQVPAYTDQEMTEILTHRYNLDDDKSRQISLLAQGDFNEALRLMEAVEQDYFGFCRDWFRTCYRGNFASLLQFTEDYAKLPKDAQKNVFQYGLELLRASFLYRINPDQNPKVIGESFVFVQNFSKIVQPTTIDSFYQILNMAQSHLMRNANVKIVFFDTSIQLYQIFRLVDANR